jgi:WhiB family transcriptional regulator, redox-sensing transcriptional regulator
MISEPMAGSGIRYPIGAGPEAQQPPTSWRKFALCISHDPELWFPVESSGGAEAIAICRACPVRLDCLGWATEHNERLGIWGGVSARGREKMRKRIVGLGPRS